MKSFLEKILSKRTNVFLVFALIGMAAYAVILPTDFKTLDDLVSIVNNPRIQDVTRIGEIFTTSFFLENSYYRPLVLFTYMFEYQLFGLEALVFNLTNVLLHILNAFLIFLIVVRIVDTRMTGFFIALIYLIHPVHWEAVSNIPGRSILLCSLFFLLGFHAFIQSKAEGRGSVWPYLFFISALLSKESAVMLPFCMMSYVFFIKKDREIEAYLKFWPYGLIIAAYIVLRNMLGITAIKPWGNPLELILGVSTFLKTCLYYIKQIILPIDFYYDHTTVLFRGFHEILLWIVLLIWGAIVTLVFKNRNRLPDAIKFFLSWIVINLVTVAQLIPIRAPGGRISTADHFLYLPVLGGIVVLVFTIKYALKKYVTLKPSIQYILIGGYCVFLFITLLQQNIYATNQIAMFRRSLQHHPGNIRVRNSLAVCFAYAQKYEVAEMHYKKALETDPENVTALIGSGKSMADQGKYAEALAQYRKVEDQELFQSYYKDNLVFVYDKLIEQYQQAGLTEAAEELLNDKNHLTTTKH